MKTNEKEGGNGVEGEGRGAKDAIVGEYGH
jgi:hypothetical protein